MQINATSVIKSATENSEVCITEEKTIHPMENPRGGNIILLGKGGKSQLNVNFVPRNLRLGHIGLEMVHHSALMIAMESGLLKNILEKTTPSGKVDMNIIVVLIGVIKEKKPEGEISILAKSVE